MVDMTEGKPFGHLWRYALPILLGNWLQLAYNAVDSIIAGRFIGRDALAAEGIAGPVMNLVILFITGLCIGSGVLMSEAFGARDYRKLRNCQTTLLLFGLLSSVLLTAVAVMLSPYILVFLAVPDEILGITDSYLRIIFLGTPFTFCYNALAAGLKSVGDSKTPLKFLAFSSVLNALLDLIFLGIFRFGIICSAVTTVMAEAVSASLALIHMIRHEKELCPVRSELHIDRALLRPILAYGGPTALQQAIQPIGKVLIQSQVNALGVNSIAAFNAVTRVDDFACIPEQGIATAIATYIAQNRGAGRNGRIRKGFRTGIAMELSYWLIICILSFSFRRPIISMFVSGSSSAAVIAEGAAYLSLMSFFYIFPALTNGFQGFYRGMGKMYTTMAGTFIQTGVRTASAFILAPRFGLSGIALSCAAGWSLMLLFEVPYYLVTCHKKGLGKEDCAVC